MGFITCFFLYTRARPCRRLNCYIVRCLSYASRHHFLFLREYVSSQIFIMSNLLFTVYHLLYIYSHNPKVLTPCGKVTFTQLVRLVLTHGGGWTNFHFSIVQAHFVFCLLNFIVPFAISYMKHYHIMFIIIIAF